MSDGLEYLQPGFDPSHLKIPELRKLFVQYEIPFPSSAKKADLVTIFEDQLRPRAKRLLAQAARVKRTSMGIENIPSSIEDSEEEPAAVAPTPRRAVRKATASATPSAASRTSRVSRRSTRTPAGDTVTDEDEAEEARTRESTARSSRRSTRTPMAESETSEAENKRVGRRKTRLSDFDPVPQVKEESADEGVNPVGESPFTTHNPFQSGSSPVTPGTARRKSTTRKSQSRRRTTQTGVRVKQEDDDEEATPVPKSRRSEGAVARLSNGKIKTDRSRTATIEPGEDFTPDEQLALEQEEAEIGKALMPARRRKPRSNVAFVGFWVVMTTLLSAVAVWWRQEKIAAGFCAYGSNDNVVALSKTDYKLPPFLEFLQPECDPCPHQAVCYSNYEARCHEDFVLKHHPLSLGGLIPLPPTCEPDSEKERRQRIIAERAVSELREQKAKYECGMKDEAGTTVSSPEISEETLKAKVSAQRRRGMSQSEFEALWDGAINDVIAREEVTRVPEGTHGSAHSNRNARLSTSSLAHLPLGCSIKRSAWLAVERHRIAIASVIATISAVLYAYYKIVAARTDRARVPTLVSTVLDRLATQAAIHADGRSPEPWISAGQLRDDVLRDIFSAARRETIWKRVKAVVEMNANVRAGVKEGRSGEVSRVWEWIGAVPALDDGYERATSRSRLSYGSADGERASRSPGESPMVKKEDHDGADRQYRRWDEGRPVY